MTRSDYTTTLLVDQTPEEAFDAINNVRGWWSEGVEGGTDKLDDEFIYHYKDIHYCKIKLIELVRDQRVVWLVLDNYFKFTKDKSEWKGTKIVFDISKKGDQTEIRFTHEGLVPHYECYEVCREAWTNYINDSLRGLIVTGKGQPNSKKDDSFDAQLVEKWKLDRKDYQKSITVNKPIGEVYAAITGHISDWWSNDLTGAAVRAGDSFAIAFGETRKTFEIMEAIPDKRVVWKCVKAYIDMSSLKNKAEWVGTRMIWTLSATDQGVTLAFLHEGLNQSFECYSVCEAGWDMFLASLQAYLTTGKGTPFLKAVQTVTAAQRQT